MGCFRVLLGLLFIIVAVPALIAFESLAALRTTLVNRATWYEAIETPAFIEAFTDEIRRELPMQGAAREMAISALTPGYVQEQLRKTVDYGFDIAEGRNPGAMEVNVPQVLVGVLSENPNFSSLNIQTQADGSVTLRLEAAQDDRAFIIGLARNLTNVLVITGAVGLSAWFLSGMIAFDTTQGRLLWLGLWLMIASGIVVIIGLMLDTTLVPNLSQALTADVERGDALTRGVIQGLTSFFGRFTSAFLLAGGIPALIGLLMLLVASTLRPPAPTIGGGLSARSGVISAE